MTPYIIRRLIHTVVILFIVSIFAFLLMHIIPGDPIRAMVGIETTEEEIEFRRAQLGLDKPAAVQYVNWIANVFRGDFGLSFRYGVPVNQLFIKRLPITAYLGILSWIVSLVFGILVGIISAVRRGTFLDQSLVVLATTGISVPIFWVGVLGIYLFGLYLGWLPIQGFVMPNVDFWNSLRYAVMPAFCLAVPSLGSVARQTRSSMLEVIQQDYIRTAKSKGLSERVVVLKHTLKNALVPVVTLVGLQVRILIGGTVLIETVFNIPGLGRLLVDAAFNKDYLIVQGGVLVVGVATCLANLAVDISYGWLDPRVRY